MILHVILFGLWTIIAEIPGIDASAASSSAYVRYLETNTWHFKFNSLEILVDPVLASPLDFGMPLIYTGKPRVVDGLKELQDLSVRCNHVLLSQGLDDHAHTPTLEKLRSLRPSMQYICPQSAASILQRCGVKDSHITVLNPGESTVISTYSVEESIEVLATNGALLGPPWQQKENGYILRNYSQRSRLSSLPSIYYEPHCMYNDAEISKYQVDYVITPIIAQLLPSFTLVDGGQKALRLAERLGAKYIVPMANGNLQQSGLLSTLIAKKGTNKEFIDLVNLKSAGKIRVLDVVPGVEIQLATTIQ